MRKEPFERIADDEDKRDDGSIFQSTSVTKPQVNDLPFAAGGTKIEKVWPFFL